MDNKKSAVIVAFLFQNYRIFRIQMMAFNEQVVSKGAFAIEAPITGGLEALKKGQMTVLMAGDKDKVKEVMQRNLNLNR